MIRTGRRYSTGDSISASCHGKDRQTLSSPPSFPPDTRFFSVQHTNSIVPGKISSMPIKIQIMTTALLLLASILLSGLTDIDLSIQDRLYDFAHHTWRLEKKAEPFHTLLYSGAKKIFISIGVGFLLVYIFFRNHPAIRPCKQGMMIVLLSLVLVPSVIGGLKKATNMPCPRHEIHYGGEYPHTAVWESWPPAFQNQKKFECWPAGHASGGFALASLFFLFQRRRDKTLVLLVVLPIAWATGIYKMLVGDHFFSHTLITMLMAWLIILIVATGVEKFSSQQTDIKEPLIHDPASCDAK